MLFSGLRIEAETIREFSDDLFRRELEIIMINGEDILNPAVLALGNAVFGFIQSVCCAFYDFFFNLIRHQVFYCFTFDPNHPDTFGEPV